MGGWFEAGRGWCTSVAAARSLAGWLWLPGQTAQPPYPHPKPTHQLAPATTLAAAGSMEGTAPRIWIQRPSEYALPASRKR